MDEIFSDMRRTCLALSEIARRLAFRLDDMAQRLEALTKVSKQANVTAYSAAILSEEPKG